MGRKRLLQGLAAVSLFGFAGGATILIAGNSSASTGAVHGTTTSSTSTTTTAPVESTTTTAVPAPSTTTTGPPPATTTTAPAPTTTTTARPVTTTTAAAPTVAGPGTVQLMELPSGDADGKAREVWVYRPAVPDSATLPVVYFLHGYPGGDLNVNSINLAGLLDQQFLAGAAPFAVAVPNGWSDIKNDTEWADSVDGEVRVESFLVSTAITAVEGAYRRDAGHRDIAG